MRCESADFIGARSGSIGCNKADIQLQPTLSMSEHTKHWRKRDAFIYNQWIYMSP